MWSESRSIYDCGIFETQLAKKKAAHQMKRMTCKIKMRAMETKMKIELYEKPMIHKPCFFQNPRASPGCSFFPTTLCGVLLFDSVSRSSSSSRVLLQPHTHLGQTPSFQHLLSHSIFHTQLCQPSSFTHCLSHNFVKHHLSHSNHHLSHIVFHTQLCQTPSFKQHVTHTPSFRHCLSHTTLSTIIFHTLSFTQLCQTPSFKHHLSHSNHHLSHIVFHTQLCQTPSFKQHLSHTLFHTLTFTHNFVKHHLLNSIFHTPSFTFHLSHTTFSTIILHTLSFTHNIVKHHLSNTIFHTPSLSTTSTFVSRGEAEHFAWQALHLVTSTFVLRGGRGTW